MAVSKLWKVTSYVMTVLLIFLLSQTLPPIAGEREISDTFYSEDTIVGINQFALDIHQELVKEKPDSNVFFSPFSISSALAMTLLGAKGTTADQIKQAFHWDKITNSDLQLSFRNLLQLLNQQGKAQYVLEAASRLFIQENYNVLEDFLLDCQQYYSAPAQTVDFIGKSEATRELINSWVQDKTHDKIKNMLKPGILNELTRLVLVNAVYFKGDWASKFKEEATQESVFHVSLSETANVQMMSQKSKFNFGYDSYLKAQILELPYKGNDLKMTIILPENGVAIGDTQRLLTADYLQGLSSKLHNKTVQVQMPRFKLKCDFDLGRALSTLGLSDLFDPAHADLSGVNGRKDLFVSRLIHKAFLEVNEEGSEAAAATAAVMEMRMMVRNQEFIMDRPFTFFIQDARTHAILFMGHLRTPAATNGKEEL